MENNVHKINRHLHDSLEKVTIQEFLREQNWFEGSAIIYPEPPDCIVKLPSGEEKWIEEISVYRHWDEQIEVNHWKYECPNDDNLYRLELIQKIVNAINMKNNKDTYAAHVKQYGQGILLLRIHDACFHWQRDLNVVTNQEHYKNIKLTQFHAVYLYNKPVIVQKKSSDPVAWESKVVPDIPQFFLLCGEEK